MATRYWEGKAVAVIQIDTVEVTAYDVATTYALTVGGVDVVSLIGVGGTVTTTADAIVLAWNDSVHPYTVGVTASNIAGVITLTADTAGEPFTVTSSDTGGTGTIGAVTSSTACDGPNFWDTAENWSSETVPVNNDDVVIDNNNIDILWNLDQSAMSGEFVSVTIGAGYRGRIGLNASRFHVNGSDATGAAEYRDHYLQIECDGDINIGEDFGTASTNLSSRIKLDLGVNACNFKIHNTGALANTADQRKPPVRLLNTNTASTLFAKQGAVGIAICVPGETATLNTINSSGARIICGSGLTINTSYTQSGGAEGSIIRAAATLGVLNIYGGSVTTEGSFIVTTVNLEGGKFTSNATGTIAALNISLGGEADFVRSKEPRTVTAVKLDAPGVLSYDPDVLTLTNNVDSNDPVRLSADKAA